MSFVVAAIIGGGASLGAAGLGFLGSQQASKTAANMQQQALTQQQGFFDRASGALQPFISGGSDIVNGVVPTLKSLLTPGADMSSVLAQTPGFQFAQKYGNIGATNALTGRGLGASAGPMAAALSQFNQGLAGNTWQNVVGSLQNFLNTGANMGTSAASSLAGAASNFGNTMGNTLTGIGNTLGQGVMGGYNALAGGLTGGSNAITNSLLLGKLFGGGSNNNAGIYGPQSAGTTGSPYYGPPQ